MSNNLDTFSKEFDLLNQNSPNIDQIDALKESEETSQKSMISKFLVLPNIILLSIPIVILIGLVYIKPKFVLDISEDKDVPPRINFKKLLMTTTVVSIILGCLCYFYLFKKFNLFETSKEKSV